MNKIMLILSASVIMAGATAASASTDLFSNAWDNAQGGGFFSHVGGQIGADPFSLAADGAINKVTWYGTAYNGLAFTDFSAIFYDDAAGNPGAVLASSTGAAAMVDTGVTDNRGQEVEMFTMNIPTFTASAGVAYHFSIADNGPYYNFTWARADGCCGLLGASWFLPDGPTLEAFTLSGDTLGPAAPGVPEPAAWALMILGMGLTGAALRRRRGAMAAHA